MVTKSMALWESAKEKHAYDVYYCCKYFPGGIKNLVNTIKLISKMKLAKEGLGKIRGKFSTANSIGPNWVADFLEALDEEERNRIKRESFELVNHLLESLKISSFVEK